MSYLTNPYRFVVPTATFTSTNWTATPLPAVLYQTDGDGDNNGNYSTSQVYADETVSSVSFKLKKNGNGGGMTVYAQLWDQAGTTLKGTFGEILASSLTTSFATVEFTGTDSLTVADTDKISCWAENTTGTTNAVVIGYTSVGVSDFHMIYGKGSPPVKDDSSNGFNDKTSDMIAMSLVYTT